MHRVDDGHRDSTFRRGVDRRPRPTVGEAGDDYGADGDRANEQTEGFTRWGHGSPHHHDGFHERMRRAVEGELARLRECVTPALSRLDGSRIPRAVISRDRMYELIVVGPAHCRPRSDLEAVWRKGHRSHFSFCRPFAAPRRRLTRRRFTSPPEVATQRERNRELKPAAHAIDAA